MKSLVLGLALGIVIGLALPVAFTLFEYLRHGGPP